MASFRYISILFFILFINIKSYSQFTNDANSFYSYAATRNASINFDRVLPCYEKTLSVSVFVVLDSLGQSNITNNQINKAIDSLNAKFSPICIQFRVCSTTEIANFQWDTLKVNDNDGLQEEAQLITNHFVDHTINLYFVAAFENLPGESGFTSYTPSYQSIFMIKDQLDDYELVHEFGHFFGLLHTFGLGNSSEYANGSNCTTTGDFLCDTPADPTNDYPTYPLSVDQYCELASGQKDMLQNWYMIPSDNLMSHYKSCRCKFTTQQYHVMAYEFLYHINNIIW
jgi:hypothetical protein